MKRGYGCGKRAFMTKEAAMERIVEIKETDHGDHKKPIRSYKCEICGHWHLTSWTKRYLRGVEGKFKKLDAIRRKRRAEVWMRVITDKEH